ncbi:MAG: hypothetical protein PVF17_02380 [Ignavibacteria bacterium]
MSEYSRFEFFFNNFVLRIEIGDDLNSIEIELQDSEDGTTFRIAK